MLLGGWSVFSDLSNDEELFAGHGNYQYDIYRMMRALTRYPLDFAALTIFRVPHK